QIVDVVPGETLRVEAGGFNALSIHGIGVRFYASDGTVIAGGTAPPQENGSEFSQDIMIPVPIMVPGPATMILFDGETLVEATAIQLNVLETVPLEEPPEDLVVRVLDQLYTTIDLSNRQGILGEYNNLQLFGLSVEGDILPALAELRQGVVTVSADPTTAETEHLEAMAHFFDNSNYEQRLNTIMWQLEGGHLATEAGLDFWNMIAAIVGFFLTLITVITISSLFWALVWLASITLSFYSLAIAIGTFTGKLGSSGSGAGSNNGNCSSPPSGGSGVGNTQPTAFGRSQGDNDLQDRFVVHIYVNDERLPFSGVTDSSGYFSIPMIPAGQPFSAIATDTQTQETRTVSGTGPEVGDITYIFFDFASEEPGEPDAIAWDGGGDGSSWSDVNNWDLDRLPVATDMVTIDIPSNPNILVNRDVSVYSLHSAENLTLQANRQLEVVAHSVISGSLTMTGESTLVAAGAAAQITLSGPANLNGGSLLAHNGGVIIAPTVALLTNGDSTADSLIQADGPGSLVDLP
ncbi:MAG: hypothetical protein KDE09_24805, partial [Anaerolineales bacterium]|nr:hypothetical protein [Anaerolineales bacterium]